ncbi:MAG: MarR family transcriptional regulator [Oscillospiraceae bacterium]
MQQMEQPIGGVVKCLSNQIRRHLDAAASEAGLVELTGTQGMILHYLLRNEGRCLTQRDVEQRFQLRGATLSRLFQRMEAAGLLERRAVRATSAASSSCPRTRPAPCTRSSSRASMRPTICCGRALARRTKQSSAPCA